MIELVISALAEDVLCSRIGVGFEGRQERTFLRKARALAQLCHRGSSPYHEASPYYPFTDYFDRVYQLSREPDVARRLDRLLSSLRSDGATDSERLARFAAVLSIPVGVRLPPLALSPERQKERTREAIIAWLNGRAERAPVLFVVEDLHWVDPSTQELLTEFVEQGANARILGLFTFRPEYDPRGRGRRFKRRWR